MAGAPIEEWIPRTQSEAEEIPNYVCLPSISFYQFEEVVDTICPKPREILEKNKVKAATDCIPYGSGSPQIEVESIGGSRYIVDLSRRTCACRRWDLTGIPCKHAIAAINFMRHKPEDYVDACYLTSTYMATYSNTVKPVNGMDLWKQSDEPTILPPQYNRQPGRPRTKRVKDASEKETDGPKLGRVQKSLKCSNCGVLGHNVTTCHRHLPPKTKAPTVSKKRKLNSGEGSSIPTKAKGTKQPPKTKNELREKAKLRAAKLKNGRFAEIDDILPNGFRVKKGDRIAYLAYAMGRMPYIWGEDAEDFRPERWLDNGVFKPESPFKFVAFHAGPRTCLGKDFAYRQIKIVAMALLCFFRFKLADETRNVTYRTMFTLHIDGTLPMLALPKTTSHIIFI